MLFKSNYTNKAISAAFFVLLLFIHSIKLLHTHSTDRFLSNDCKGSILDIHDDSKILKASSDCDICSYQLNKDADDLVYPALSNPIPGQIEINCKLISFYSASFHSAFENRGPPSLV